MLDRRQFGKGVAAMGASIAAMATGIASGKNASGVRVEGPVIGGQRNQIFGARADDLAAHGYV